MAEIAASTAKRNPPFRAEQVGSLLRPDTLKRAYDAFRREQMDRPSYLAELDRAIADAVKLQEDVGLQSITDGEFRRNSWFGFFFAALEGFRLATASFTFKDKTGASFEWPTCYANAPIRRTDSICGIEFDGVRRFTDRCVKATMPTPSAFHFFRFDGPVDTKIYPDIDLYWQDLETVYRAEIADLAARGCRYVQFDEVPIAMLCDELVRDRVRSTGINPDDLLEQYIRVMERILSDRPADMAIALHMCRGNFRGRWMAEGGYDAIAEKFFNRLPVDAFLLEYDTPRAGDFQPLRFVPDSKRVVLGLVSTKKPSLESTETLTTRIEEASKILPLENLALSPQCGFASVAGGNALTADEQRAKLARVVDLARQVWGDVAA